MEEDEYYDFKRAIVDPKLKCLRDITQSYLNIYKSFRKISEILTPIEDWQEWATFESVELIKLPNEKRQSIKDLNEDILKNIDCIKKTIKAFNDVAKPIHNEKEAVHLIKRIVNYMEGINLNVTEFAWFSIAQKAGTEWRDLQDNYSSLMEATLMLMQTVEKKNI